jgi:hypothetical protein
MRYQLRYIRAPRARSSPGAKDDDSRTTQARTNPLLGTVKDRSDQPIRLTGRREPQAVVRRTPETGQHAAAPHVAARLPPTVGRDRAPQPRFLPKLPIVLVFDVVRPPGAGPVAQWKSVRFTRGRSLVRSQPGPLTKRPGQSLYP